MAAYAAHHGPTGDRELDAVVQRLNAAASAGTSKAQPTPAPAPPPAPPPPPIDLPKVPLIQQGPPRLPTLRDIMIAALSPRGRGLMAGLGLTPTESAIIDILLDGDTHAPHQLRERLPDELRTSTDAALTVMISRLRRKVPLSFEDLQNLPNVGYRMSDPCRARIEAALPPAEAAS